MAYAIDGHHEVAPPSLHLGFADYYSKCLNHLHGTTPMKYLPTLAAVCLLIGPSVARG